MSQTFAEQIKKQLIEETQDRIKLILQKLLELENHTGPIGSISECEEPKTKTTTLASIITNAIDQASAQGLSQKKRWLLLAERLEDARRLGIYNQDVNTICRFICSIFPGLKPNSIRKALPDKYKDPHQSKIAHHQAKGLTASIYRDHKQKMKSSKQSSGENASEVSASSLVTPYKDLAHDGYSFVRWLRRSRKRKYNIGIFKMLKKDKALVFFKDPEFALWYVQEAYHPSQEELSAVRRAMKTYERLKQ
jgi:hypothetical protein